GVAHRFQNAAADRRRDDAPRGVAQLISPAQLRTQPARKQRRREQRPEAELEPFAPIAEARAVLRAHAAELGVVNLRAAGALDARPDLVARGGEAGQREARDEERR